MAILQRYLTKTIIYATSIVLLIIVGISFLLMLIGEMKIVGQGDYDLVQAFWYVMLRIPAQVYQFSPLIILLGSIIGLSMLNSHRELAVMRASGYSVLRILLSVLIAGFLLMLIFFGMGEAWAPNLSYQAEINKENARNAGQAMVTNAGIWFHVNNNFIHVEQMLGHYVLKNVTRYDFNAAHKLEKAYFVKQLNYTDGKWLMNDVVQTSFLPDQTRSTFIASATWDLPLNVNLLNVGSIEASEMNLAKLANYMHYLQKNELQSAEYQYNFWQRIMQPLASLIMVLLSVPFVLTTFSRTTVGWRITLGLLMGFAFFMLNSLLGQMSIVFQIKPIYAASLPIIFFTVISLLLIKRMKYH